MDELLELTQDFLVEAFEMIEQLDQDLVELESRPDDLELLNGIFRVAHTIKGSSSFLNFDILTKLTHHMEDVLNKARKAEIKITHDVMDVVLESIDMMKGLLGSIRDSGTDTEAGINIEPVVKRLDAVSSGGSLEKIEIVEEKKETQAPVKVVADDIDYSKMSDDEVEAEIERLLKERQEEDKAKRKAKVENPEAEVFVSPEPVVTKSAPVEPMPAPVVKEAVQKKEPVEAKASDDSDKKDSNSSAVEQTIRVDVNRLDHLMNLIGELVLGKNRLLKIYDDVEERYEGEQFLEELNAVVSSVSMVTTDLQMAVMKTRMLAIGKVFNKFPRMIRDLSRELGKKMELNISGEETELDKSIVEVIGDPLVHIIRNSADHGIEMPEVRTANGKPEQGMINLKAYNEGNTIVIQIEDDGKGLDPEILKSKALEKNVISEREADIMSEKEAYSLIFKPGFSTAAKVTNVSGRGVGMDVVKTNIEKLNGIIDVDSEVGKGTIIKLKIPLTLAIIQALMVGVQEEFYAIPLSSVLETVRISEDDIYTVEGKSVMRLRDEVLSLVKLSDIFGVESTIAGRDFTYVVVLGLAEQKLGLIVDELVGQEEIVIKSLGNYLQDIEGIAGATIRGDGGVTLITDVGVLMQMSKNVRASVTKSGVSGAAASKRKEKPSDYRVLIVDDSKTDRTIMRKSIEPLGVSIVEAADGQEALGIIKGSDEAFDTILIDIEMPKMDGYTLATEIRQFSRFRSLPLIAVTSRTNKADRMRGVEAGMSEYITKPYSPEYLFNVVKRRINYNVEMPQ